MSKFCPKCNFILDIEKNIDLIKVDDINKMIKLLLNGNINLNTSISFNDIKKNAEYDKLSSEEKTLLDNNYSSFKNLNKVGFFKCLNCEYFTNIKNKTILIDSSKSQIYKSDLYFKLQKNNDILPRTRDYICPNKNCKAHDKNFKEREAVFYRVNNTYRLKYLCTICDMEWQIGE